MGCGQSDNKQPEAPIQIGYWQPRGVAQAVRSFAEYLGVSWENKNYTGNDWFGKDKQQFTLQGQCLANLPYIKDGETLVFESAALPVYLALKQNRMDAISANIDDMINVATVHGAIEDLRSAIMKVFFSMPFAEYQKNGKESLKKTCAPHLKKIEWTLRGRQYLIGEKVVYEDFVLFELTDVLRHYDIEFLRSYTNIFNHNNSIRDIPQIKIYMASSKFQARPFYNPKFSNWA